MTQVILFAQDIPNLALLKSSLTVPYSTVDAVVGGANAYRSKLTRASDALPLIQSMDLSDTNTVGILYENTHGLIHNLSDLVGGLVEKSSTIKIIDLLTCNLNRDDEIVEIKELEATHGVTIRYSIDLTGHEDSMGNWLLESHGVEVKDMYFNEKIDEWKHVLHWSSWAGFYGGWDSFKAVVKSVVTADGTSRNIDPNKGVDAQGFPWDNRTIISVEFKPDIKTIGDYAFYYCNGLTSIVIPNSVKTIGTDAFRYCDKLTTVVIGNSVESIGDRAFSACTSLTSITIPYGVETIDGGAFYYCTGLTTVVIPNTVKTIGVGAFSSCTSLTSITIPNSVKTIGAEAFYNCDKLTTVVIPNTVTTIGGGVFTNTTCVVVCINNEIDIPSSSRIIRLSGGLPPSGDTDLSGVNLSGINLSGVNLSGVNLSGANLYGATTANIIGVPTISNNYVLFPESTNQSTNQSTNIIGPGVHLPGADISGANLFGANLSDINFSNTNMFNSNGELSVQFGNNNLTGATLGPLNWTSTNAPSDTATPVKSGDDLTLKSFPDNDGIMKVYLVPNSNDTGANDLTDVPLSALSNSVSWPRATPPQSAAVIIQGIKEGGLVEHWGAGIDWNVPAAFADKYIFSSEIGNDDDLKNKIVLDDHSGASIDVSGNTMDQTVFVGCKFTSTSKTKLSVSKVALLGCSFDSQ